MPYKHNEPRRHKIPKARYKVSNWREYDQALQQRGSLTVWVTPEALEAWAPEKTGRRGRPTSYSDIVIETAVMLRLAMGKPWRQTEGMLSSIIGMLGLDLPVPDHTTLSRRSACLTLTTTLKKPKGPVNVVIDSSGLKIFGAGGLKQLGAERHDRLSRMTALGSGVSPQARRQARTKRLSRRRHSPSRVHRANSVYSVPNGMSHRGPIARHCMPQNATHPIARIALRSAAPASDGL